MTLYKVADTTKKILIGVVAVLAILLVVRIVVSIIDNLSRTLITEFSVATRGFGDLPDLTLKQIEGAESQNPSFSIETLSGKLPEVNTLFNVYRIVQPNKTLSSEAFAQNAAATLGFTTEPDKLSAIEWEWAEGTKRLTFNVQNQHFSYVNSATIPLEESEFPDDPSTLLSPLLEEIGYTLPEDATFRFEYVEELNGQFIPTPNFQAAFVRVSMVTTLNNNVDSPAEVASGAYHPSTVYVIIANQDNPSFPQVRAMGYSLWSVDTENKQTYYGISAEDAYTRLQDGGRALVFATYTRRAEVPSVSSASDVRITDVKIGYYCPEAYITYLQPVYLFYAASGEGESRIDLIYYVPAL